MNESDHPLKSQRGEVSAAGAEASTENADNGTERAKPWLKVGWKFALAAGVAGFIVYRLHFAPVPVGGSVAAMGPIVSDVMGTGTLEARVQATISPKISGLVTQVLGDQGDRITKGQLLVTLDDGDLRQQVEMAKADLAAVKAGVDRAAADITSAEAVAVQVRASYTRNAQLSHQKFISDEDLDKATQQRDVAEAQLKRAQLAKVEIERQVVKAEETLRYYQARLADTRITCPFDGLVVRRSREPGDIVVPGSEILKIIATEQMWVSAWVDETAISALATGQVTRVVFRSEPDKAYSGTVTRIAPLADRETREFLVDVTVNGLPAAWAVGQRAEVYIRTGQKDAALLAPPQALVWRKGQPGLFVDHAGHAQWRSVTLGLRDAEAVEVAKGLVAGERVIWPRDPKGAGLVEGRAVSKP
jgi:RND family efflux transporter MFP subunit